MYVVKHVMFNSFIYLPFNFCNIILVLNVCFIKSWQFDFFVPKTQFILLISPKLGYYKFEKQSILRQFAP